MRRFGAVVGAVWLVFAFAVPAGAGQIVRQVLYDQGSFYPKVVLLRDGRMLAGVTTNIGRDGVGVIEASADGGRSFQQVAQIRDSTAANGGSVCCASLFVLPSQVGGLPAGTVLWAASTGSGLPTAQRTSRQRLWASEDDGLHWHFVSDIAVAPNHYNTWEPSLSVARDGELVAFYSDETDKQYHDQKLVQVRSADAVHWTDYRETVVSDQWEVRPGMANVIRLPDRSYFMSYEVCNNDLVHLCGVYFRRSADGWDYGDPRDLGTTVRTADGEYLRHTPFPAWSAGAGPRWHDPADQRDDRERGRQHRAGERRRDRGELRSRRRPLVRAPGADRRADVNNTGCKNFSPGCFPSPDGTSLLEVDTDLAGTVCETYYATEPLYR